MRASRIALAIAPAVLMAGSCLVLTGIEAWLSKFGTTPNAHLVLGRIGIALSYVMAAAIGVVFLFAAAGATAIRWAGWSVMFGGLLVVAIAASREIARLHSFANALPAGDRLVAYADPSTIIGATIASLVAVFGLRVAIRGNAAFAAAEPRRIRGRRAIHGESDWMTMIEAARLFPEAGGIVVGERYRVDRDAVADQSFRADDVETWGAGGKSPLLCFDASSARRTASCSPGPAASRQHRSRCRRRSNGVEGWSSLTRPTRSHRWSPDTGTGRVVRSSCSTRAPRRSASMCSTGSASTAQPRKRTLPPSRHGS
ncbi:hypothetical protein ACVWXM_003088 [Bradyrhizobium sp. GM7.3]